MVEAAPCWRIAVDDLPMVDVRDPVAFLRTCRGHEAQLYPKTGRTGAPPLCFSKVHDNAGGWTWIAAIPVKR